MAVCPGVDAAKRKAPCIIFIDEIDAVGSARNPKDQQMVKMTLNQLLVEMDGCEPRRPASASLHPAAVTPSSRAASEAGGGGPPATVRFSSTEGVIVIGATNFPELLDKALVRPGRFDRHVTVPLPDVRGREQILRLHTKKVPLGADVNLGIVARGTPGFSGPCTRRSAPPQRAPAARPHRHQRPRGPHRPTGLPVGVHAIY